MERITTEQLSQQREHLERRFSRLEAILPHLPEEGFIESYLEKRSPKFTNRLPNLKLANVDPITYFNRLTGPIKRVQDRIIDKTLPYLSRRIAEIDAQIAAEKSQPVPTVSPAEKPEEKQPEYKFIIDPEPQPLMDYSGLISHPKLAKFLEETRNPFIRSLLEQFLQSKNSIRILNAIVSFYQRPKSERNDVFFEQHLAGDVFAQLGYLFISAKYSDLELTFLSPEETLTLYRNANPNTAIEDDSGFGLNRSLEETITTDTLAITDKPEIMFMVEYKNIGSNYNHVREATEIQSKKFNADSLKNTLKLTKDPKESFARYLGHLLHLLRPGTILKF